MNFNFNFDGELNNLLSCVTIAQVACCQTSIKSYFHTKKKAKVDPGTLPQLRGSYIWQGYLICFWNGTKEFNGHTCHSKKKILSLLEHLKTFNLKALRTFNPFMHNVVKWPNILWKPCGIHTARFLKHVWPFYNIIHERVKSSWK